MRRSALLLVFSAALLGMALPASGESLAEVGTALLESMSAQQRAAASWAFEDDEREDIHFAPFPLDGVEHGELSPAASAQAESLLALALSERGYATLRRVRDLELAVLEKERDRFWAFLMRGIRDPGRYLLAFFGVPSDSEPWGFRYEGHHLSLNLTAVPGVPLATTPLFLGAEPRLVPQGWPSAGIALLGEEERLARGLHATLPDALRARATLDFESGRGLLLGEERRVEPTAAVGLARAEMPPAQQAQLDQLVERFIGLFAEPAAAAQRARLEAAGRDSLRFAFASGDEPPNAYYVRVQGRTLLIEIWTMRFVKVLLGVLFLVGAAFGIGWAATQPEGLPQATESHARLAPGPHAIGRQELRWVDASRPTTPNADFAGAPSRELAVALWHPVDAPGPHPLVVYSHGFMSNRHGGAYLAEHLASYGYVVVSTDYPLTHFAAPGGPNVADAVNQPGDVSFMIDTVLALDGEAKPFTGEIDPTRIGVFGLSLGGLTTTLVAFHPELRDPRIAAAISIAGPTMLFSRRYFEFADVPFLMVGGTSDAMIDFESNAANVPGMVPGAGLFAIEGGTHAGFSNMASGPMRLLGNPDGLGCNALLANIDLVAGENPFVGIGTPEQGILDAVDAPMPCGKEFDSVMAAGRQHLLTTLAVRAFFESHFARDAGERSAHAEFLRSTAPRELSEVSFTGPSRS
jgi:dienelactone hydrolase